jgi:lysophospholipase L1-like esterase
MPLTPRKELQVPDFWTVFGHSYMNYSFGTYFQTGRADSLFRAGLDIEFNNWQNYAVSGSRVTTETRSTGGFAKALARINRPTRGGPYVSDGGAALLCWGINDMGINGVTTQVRTAYIHAMRTVISRWRASVIYENDFQVGTRTSYGAGFGSVAVPEYCSGGTVHWCTATTNANFTLTLPSDYNGEPVGIGLVGAGGTSGGIVTWSGTAGVTGTTSTSDIMPSAAATHSPVTKRITNLTSANAGQTIIGTVNTLDAGGAVMLDCWWLESKVPPPVIVCNIAKLPAAGYTANYASWSGTEASRDADVDTWNTDLNTLVAEFDSMVQVADINAAVGKSTTYLYTDNLHPNERGAARIADACRDAMRRLTPTSDSPTENLNPSSPRTGGLLKPHTSGSWYTTDYHSTIATGVVTTIAAAGALWAIPIWVTSPRERISRLAMQVGSTAGTACTIRWGLYEDLGWSGYPRELVTEPTASSGALTTGVAANAVILSPTSGNGSISQFLDPGLYWLAMLTVTATAQTWVQLQGPSSIITPVASTGAPLTTAAAQLNGWKATGVATTALPTTFPTGATATAGAPYIGAQISINPLNA